MKMRYVYLSCVIALTMAVRGLGQTGQYKKWLADDGSQAANGQAAEQAARNAQEQRALKLLDQVIAESNALKVPENRIHILAVASGLVWPRDEKRARELLKTAADTLAGMIGSVDPSDPTSLNDLSQLSQTRNELFQAALNYDPVAALDFLRKTPIPGMADQGVQLELEAAWRIAAVDPRTALQIGEQALANGVTSNLAGLVSQLHLKDPAAAQQLASDILSKVQSEDLASNSQLFWLAMSMVQPAVQAAGAEAAADAGRAGPSSGLVLQPADLRSLINKLVSTSLNLGKGNFNYGGEWQTARNALTQIQALLPQIEKIDPQLGGKLAGQISTALQTVAASNPSVVLQNLAQNGTADDLIRGAETAPAAMRDQYYQQAAWKAMNQNDLDKAAEIVNQKYTSPIARQQMLDQIEQRLVWQASNDGKIDEARLLIGRIRSKEQRVQALMNLAAIVIAKGDKKKAVELLDEARAGLPEAPENYQHVSLLMTIASHYSRVDPSRGVQIMNGIGGLLGRLIPAAEALEGFDIQSTFKYGEILMQPRSQLGSTMVQFAEQLGNLATADYGAAITAADNAGRPELRIMADLSIAARVLNEVTQNAQNQPPMGRQFITLTDLRRQE